MTKRLQHRKEGASWFQCLSCLLAEGSVGAWSMSGKFVREIDASVREFQIIELLNKEKHLVLGRGISDRAVAKLSLREGGPILYIYDGHRYVLLRIYWGLPFLRPSRILGPRSVKKEYRQRVSVL